MMRIMKIARKKFVIFYFQSRFYLVSPWNLLLTRETNGFLCHAKMKREKEKVETLFLTKQSSPLLFSNNKFQRGGKEEIVDVQINRDWDLKSLENSYDSPYDPPIPRTKFFHQRKIDTASSIGLLIVASHIKKNLLLELILSLLSFLF